MAKFVDATYAVPSRAPELPNACAVRMSGVDGGTALRDLLVGGFLLALLFQLYRGRTKQP
jgi:hypothetical protein